MPITFGTEYPKNLVNGFEDVAAPAEDVKKWREMRAAGMAEKSPREFCEAEWKVMPYVLAVRPESAARVKSYCHLENELPNNFMKHLEHHWASVKKIDLTQEQIASVTHPVLTIHGTKDRNAPYGAGREWALRLPNARLVTVENAAHQAWADDPATVFASIREFLRGNWPLGSEKVVKLER